ncbi:gamma carbonic anhydrase family protein [Thiotrichales bacterium 19S3-7]|nr:gamma carbonic anhydrase family protein [Thiotrichales bacterium 19S3-7]MCF6802466.1 gamma carbonic anhydrase family protein [Thiotrichales bacterium 19S3-11]
MINQSKSIRSINNHTPKIGRDVFIDPSAVISGDVILDDDVSVWPCVSIRGDLEKITIGKRSNVQDNTTIHTTRRNNQYPEGFPVSIGEDVTIGHGAIIHGCALKDRILVGMGAILLDGAIVQSDIMIAAGALVTPGTELETGYLYVGSPAKKIRPLSEIELQFLKISSDNYLETKNQHLEASKLW